MRVILWLVLVLGIVWGGYWFVGARAIEAGVTDWFAGAASQGIQARQSGISVSGFANRFDLTVTEPHLTDPRTGWGWQAPFAQVFAMTWKPWHVIAVLPNDQLITGPDGRIAVTSSKMDASLRLVPSGNFPLAEVVFDGRDVFAKSDQGWQFGAKSIVAAMARQAGVTNGQRLGLDILDLAPDPALMGLVPQLGAVISAVHLDATVTLTAPLDRHLAQIKPNVTGIHLTDFLLSWGEMRLAASGQVAARADGLAEGKIDLHITNWRSIPALIVAMGLVKPGMGASLTSGLQAMAQSGGNPDELTLALIFKDGRMSFGPVPLGPAPRLN